jgi:hypothetical protein
MGGIFSTPYGRVRKEYKILVGKPEGVTWETLVPSLYNVYFVSVLFTHLFYPDIYPVFYVLVYFIWY